jgi:anthranilate synthase component 1
MKHRMDLIYKCIPNSRYTPYLLAKKIGARAILESASFAKGRERYSILMTEEAFKIKQDEEKISLIINGKEEAFDVKAAMEGEKSYDALGHEKSPDILDALLYIAGQNVLPEGPLTELPLPASGLGYLSYEFAKHCDNIRFFEQKDDLNIPESLFVTGHIYIIFDLLCYRLDMPRKYQRLIISTVKACVAIFCKPCFGFIQPGFH